MSAVLAAVMVNWHSRWVTDGRLAADVNAVVVSVPDAGPSKSVGLIARVQETAIPIYIGLRGGRDPCMAAA